MTESYEILLFSFIEKLNTLQKVLPATLLSLTRDALKAMKEFDLFIREKCVISDENEESFSYEVPVLEIRAYKQKKTDAEDLFLSLDVVGKSYIVTLVSQFDQFIAELIRLIYTNKPELVNELGKSLTVSELRKFDSIEEALQDLVTKEIDSIMRESHLAQVEYLQRKINGDIKADKDLLKRFVELTERRNLFVHTDGVISKQYLEVCNREGLVMKDEHKLGFRLESDPEYFNAAIDTLNEFAVKTVIFVVKKLHPDETESTKDFAIHSIYKNLEFRNFETVRKLVKYVAKMCDLNRSDQMIVAVNNVLSYYLSGKTEDAKKQLEAIDWSDASDRFRLAKAVVLEDYPAAAKVMKRIGADDDSEITEIDYHQWPLFTKFRESTEFKVAYRETFGRDFDSVEQNPLPPTVVEVNASTGNAAS